MAALPLQSWVAVQSPTDAVTAAAGAAAASAMLAELPCCTLHISIATVAAAVLLQGLLLLLLLPPLLLLRCCKVCCFCCCRHFCWQHWLETHASPCAALALLACPQDGAIAETVTWEEGDTGAGTRHHIVDRWGTALPPGRQGLRKHHTMCHGCWACAVVQCAAGCRSERLASKPSCCCWPPIACPAAS